MDGARPGDGALLKLAELRFAQLGLAAEVYAGTLDERSRAMVGEFADRFAGRVAGLVVHDKREMAGQTDRLLAAMVELNGVSLNGLAVSSSCLSTPPAWSRPGSSAHPGPSIVRAATEACGPQGLSFTLEIHQVDGRLPLADASRLFPHWRDTTNAERQNYWLSVLGENALLVSEGLGAS